MGDPSIDLQPSPRDITAELQALYRTNLGALLRQGQDLLIAMPKRTPKLAHLVFVSMAQRLFLLLEDAHESFQAKPGRGYFTTAAVTRNMMEAATVLMVINRDPSGAAVSSLLYSAEVESTTRREGLAQMQKAINPDISQAAAAETARADGVINCLQQIKAQASLPPNSDRFPGMKKRCQLLGEIWEFQYEATYRELCEAVHSAFTKIPHAPSLAFRAPDEGAALLYEHARALNYAVQFWGVAVADSCINHPNPSAVTQFHTNLGTLLHRGSAITDKFSSITKHHTLSF